MQTDEELELRLNLTIREYDRLTSALRLYQVTMYDYDAREWLEVEHLRTKLAEGFGG